MYNLWESYVSFNNQVSLFKNLALINVKQNMRKLYADEWNKYSWYLLFLQFLLISDLRDSSIEEVVRRSQGKKMDKLHIVRIHIKIIFIFDVEVKQQMDI